MKFIAAIACLAVLGAVCAQVRPHKHFRKPPKRLPVQNLHNPTLVPGSGVISVDITPSHTLSHLFPDRAFGAGVDSISAGEIPQLFAPINVSKMLGAGFGTISYRLYTELNVQDWHWNPIGTWSDAANQQGYFTSSANVGSKIVDSYGYSLAHRGATYDYGDSLAYSNLTDGDTGSYWKSDPYLSTAYTHDPDSQHPQWLFLDLGSTLGVNAVQIQWSNPYAVSYQVQYWTGDDPLYDPTVGNWATFPNGTVTTGKGGLVTLKVAATPVQCQYVRIVMTQSSGTYDTHGSSDARNKMGYAVAEVGVGSVDSFGTFTDYVVHSTGLTQTVAYVSSTDPWHSAAGQVLQSEQIGLDYQFQSSLQQHKPALVAVPMLYSTPENAVAEVQYLTQRHYPIQGVELGEEPDGAWVTPEDEAALYVQWATAIHKACPLAKLGGPVTSYNGVQTWADSSGNTDFLKRFYAYLVSHGAANLLNFVSMEHYPFYQAALDWTLVPQEPAEVQSIFDWVSKAGIPKSTPVIISEYNLSAAPDQPIVDVLGALWHAVFVGEFFKRGGSAAYYYQYFPYSLSNGGTSYGLIGMLLGNDADQILQETSQYYSSQMMGKLWCLPGDRPHTVVPATSGVTDTSGNPLVLPYALERPDGQYSLMLVNTDIAAHSVSVAFTNGTTHQYTGAVSVSQFSPKDYVWVSNLLSGYAKPDGPVEQTTVQATGTTLYSLPAHSITVLRGRVK